MSVLTPPDQSNPFAPPQAPAPGPPWVVAPPGYLEPAPPRRRRVWPWVLLGIGLALGGLVALMVGYFLLGIPGVEDAKTVYADNFSSNSGQFEVFDDSLGSGAYRDGAYWLSSTGPGGLAAYIPVGPADVVDESATLTLTTTSPTTTDGAALFVERGTGEGYAFVISRARGAAIVRYASDGTASRVAAAGAALGTAPVNLRLTVAWKVTGTEVIGYFNGRELIRYTDSQGWDQFTQAGVDLGGGPAALRVDDVLIKTAGTY